MIFTKPKRLSPLAGHIAEAAQNLTGFVHHNHQENHKEKAAIHFSLRENLNIVALSCFDTDFPTINQAVKDYFAPDFDMPLDVAPQSAQSLKDEKAILWQAPYEWLLISNEMMDLYDDLPAHLPDTACLVDQTHGRSCFRLIGPGAKSLLNLGCKMDLRMAGMEKQHCYGTEFFQIHCHFHVMNADLIDIYAPRSFALHLFEMVKRSIA